MASDSRALGHHIADSLQKYIQSHPSLRRLPPIRRLSQTYNVSPNTILDAVGILAGEGIVIRRQGSGVLIAGREVVEPHPPEQSEKHTPAERVRDYVRDRINDGTYRRRNPLPKTAFLSMRLGVSHHAVTAAYRLLREANLAHKQGRRWIAGPRITASVTAPAGLPVVVLLQSRESFWADMAKRDFFEAFCRSFQSEVESYDVQLMPALFDTDSPSSGILPAGLRAVHRFIRSLGHRYRGCLICNAMKEREDLPRWLEELSRFKQPVVWFDRLKENPSLKISSPWLVRCHEAEEYAVQLALTHLYELEHRHVAFPVYAPLRWVENRGRMIARLAERMAFESLSTSSGGESLFFGDGTEEQAAFLRACHDMDFPCINSATSYIQAVWGGIRPVVSESVHRAYRRDRFAGIALLVRHFLQEHSSLPKPLTEFPVLPWLVALTPVLSPILAQKRITALIAPNDQAAHWYYLWLRAYGLRVPQDISLISFDNLWRLQSLPITSVDFGYGYLGFAAFHSIMRDITLTTDRTGTIAAQPRIVRRGTVAKPGEGFDREPFRAVARLLEE
jgi:DNA-binding LacI/PurR family transcriptional regulator/DNA-binding transcriptional regulator YhcF (GntR family)